MEEMIKSPFDLFAGVQETYEEAIEKSAQESKSFAKTKHFRMDSAGTYSVRILPLAPVKQADGTYNLERKGYEYPTKTQLLKITNPNSKSKKDQQYFVSVTHADYVGLSVDLIDTYISVASEKYGDDEKLIKKIKGTSFEGGLKWSSQRAMYVIDMDKRSDGIQLLTLSYSQYKDLEDRKIAVWEKLRSKNPKAFCPVSSIQGAYPVEIARKEENKKTTYTFNIDVLSDVVPLDEGELKALLDAPRIPEVLYRYSRFHLEATIEFLKQYDEKNEMDVMSSKAMQEAIEKIKMELPADDKSHFSFERKDSDAESSNEAEENTIDNLWKRWESLNERGIGDKSEEGQELRDDIRAFIDDNSLSVRVVRGKTNEDLLVAIEDALEVGKNAQSEEQEQEDEAEEVHAKSPEVASDDEDEESEGEDNEEEVEDSESEEAPNVLEIPDERPAGSRRSARPVHRRAR